MTTANIFIICLMFCFLALFSGLITSIFTSKELLKVLHRLFGYAFPLIILICTALLFFRDAHRFLVYVLANFFLWVMITGPVLRKLSDRKPLKILHELFGIVSTAAISFFIYIITHF